MCPACGRANTEDQRFCDGCGQRLEPDAPEPAVASSVPMEPATAQRSPISFAGGRYRVERVLGEGGQKRVYLAHDTILDRRVALGLVTERVDADLAERARREAQTMGRLAAHPNLVTVYDAGEEGGQPYMVEEYIDGTTLAAVIKEAAGTPLELGRVLGIALDVCAALDQVHRCGIVHRDLKPDNVWLTADGTAKLGDFGLLAAVREFSSRTMAKLTGQGLMVGTVPYMPPEQALGERVDERADLYALGAMLYEMVTGSPPFVGDDALAIVSQHLRTPPVAPSWHNHDVPAALNDLILSLLAKDARDRPPSAAAARSALEAIAAVPHRESGAPGARHNPLEGLARGVYVGREAELDELCAALDAAVAGRGQMVF